MKLVLVAFALMLSCGGGDNPQPTPLPPVTTAGGAVIYSPVTVPKEAQDAIDAGIKDAVDRRLPGWENYREPTVIRFEDPTGTAEGGEPALVITYSDGGTGLIAGQANGFCTRDPNECARTLYQCGEIYIRLPHQAQSGWRYLAYLREAAHNEKEHELEGKNSAQEFCRYAWPNPDMHWHRP